jgi:hypothetical protein
MDIKSLNEYIRPSEDGAGLNNLFRPVLLRADIKSLVDVRRHEVKQEEEMRIDLILQNIYEIPSNQVFNYLEQIDVLLALNNIDNPLNIRKGLVIYYPSEIGKLDDFRNNQTEDQDLIKSSVAKKLAVPNKTTRKDKSRSAYLESGYSLPPVVQEIPKPPVRIDNDRFSIGGL